MDIRKALKAIMNGNDEHAIEFVDIGHGHVLSTKTSDRMMAPVLGLAHTMKRVAIREIAESALVTLNRYDDLIGRSGEKLSDMGRELESREELLRTLSSRGAELFSDLRCRDMDEEQWTRDDRVDVMELLEYLVDMDGEFRRRQAEDERRGFRKAS